MAELSGDLPGGQDGQPIPNQHGNRRGQREHAQGNGERGVRIAHQQAGQHVRDPDRQTDKAGHLLTLTRLRDRGADGRHQGCHQHERRQHGKDQHDQRLG